MEETEVIWKGDIKLKRGRIWKKHFCILIKETLLIFHSEEASRLDKPVQQIKFRVSPIFANCTKKKTNCFKLLFQDELHFLNASNCSAAGGNGWSSYEYQYTHARIENNSHKVQFLQALRDSTESLVIQPQSTIQSAISMETVTESTVESSPTVENSLEFIPETTYVLDKMHERRKMCSNHSQKRNQSMLFSMARQLWDSPGLELSKVSLPAFVFEPLSFLEKLTEPLFHGYLLAKANKERDALERMKYIIKIHFASLYAQQTKQIKKCYNPILGEIHRSYWDHGPKNRTYFVAENVSHHPPIQALYAINRREGFSMEANTEIEPKLHTNSVVAKFGGKVVYKLHNHNEVYETNCPDGMGRNVLMGAFIFEFIGTTYIRCQSSGYRADLEFRHKNPWKPWQPDMTHTVVGTVTKHGDLIGTVCGKWNEVMYYTHKGSKDHEVLWDSNHERKKMLPYYVVEPSQHFETESRRIWSAVNDALLAGKELDANTEKVLVEERERSHRRLREQKKEEYNPKLFKTDGSGFYSYIYKNTEEWNDEQDEAHFEHNGVIGTRQKHQLSFLRSIRETDEDNASEHSPQISANETTLSCRSERAKSSSSVHGNQGGLILNNVELHANNGQGHINSTSVQCLVEQINQRHSMAETMASQDPDIDNLRSEMSQLTNGISILQEKMQHITNNTQTSRQMTALWIFLIVTQLSICFILAKDRIF